MRLGRDALLMAWDMGHSRTPDEWAISVLSLANPHVPLSALQRWPVGRRDHALLAIRDALFGTCISANAACDQCKESLEFEMHSTDFVTDVPTDSPDAFLVDSGSYQATVRLPNTLDLIAAQSCREVAEARNLLFKRCVTAVRHNNQAIAIDDVPEAFATVVTEHMASRDPNSDIRFSVACPACGNQWDCVFDVVPYFWRELNVWALRTFREIHQLASAYGWNESDILAMNPSRRRVYLGMLGA